MKMRTLLWSVVAFAALTACNKDESNGTGEQGKPVSFRVQIPSAAVTYSVDDPAAAAVTPYYESIVMYMVNGLTTDTHEWTDAEIKARTVTLENIMKPSEVIVVINGKNMPTGATNKTAIEAAFKTQTVGAQNNTEPKTLAAEDAKGNAAGTYTPMQQVVLRGSQTDFTVTPVGGAGGRDLLTAKVELKSLVSRFEIGTVKSSDETALTDLRVEAVYLNYFFKTNDLTLADNMIAYERDTWPTGAYDPSWATNTGSAEVTSEAGTKVYAYQVFAGGRVPHIIFKVAGTLKAGHELPDGTKATDADVAFTGKYVTISGFKENGNVVAELVPHNIYKVGVTNGGIPIAPANIQKDPEVISVDFKVDITVAPWTSTEVTPEI